MEQILTRWYHFAPVEAMRGGVGTVVPPEGQSIIGAARSIIGVNRWETSRFSAGRMATGSGRSATMGIERFLESSIC